MAKSSFEPEYVGGVAVFQPNYEDFRDFRQFVKAIEPIGMETGIVKVIPPKEWISQLPKIPTASTDSVEIRNPIIQNFTVNGGRGIFGVDNVEKRRKYSLKQWVSECDQLHNQPPAKRGEKQRILGKFAAPEGGFVDYDDSDFRDPELTADIAAKYWKSLAYGGSPMYGADLPGSLFDDRVTEWNVAKLDSVLKLFPGHIPGVTDAYLYCGMWRATFSWHLEDVDLPSINYIHFGAPKQWYSVPQKYHEQFYNMMSAIWPEEQEKCSEFLRHKTFLVDPVLIEKHGIPVNKVVHYQNEFVITFPYGYHAGFNYGFNVAESVNFASERWIDIGKQSKKCNCVSHSVGLDVELMAELIDNPEKAEALAVEAQQPPPKKRHRTSTAASKPVKLHHTYHIKDAPSMQLGRCVLCPNIYNNEYKVNQDKSLLAHVACVNLTPETYFSSDKTTILGLEDIVFDRFELRCAHCKKKHGSCFQCSLPECTRAYHGTCAAAAGVDYRLPSSPLCRFHRGELEPTPQAAYALPGDVIQLKRGRQFLAGLVKQNDYQNKQLVFKTLPNPDLVDSAGYDEVLCVFDEIPEEQTIKKEEDN